MSMPDYSLFGDEHVRQYEATGGKTGHDWNNTSCLVLHTIGRKSGETKKFPLIYGRDGNNYLLVASKGGAPDHPGWYKNLLAHPDVKIQVWDKLIPVRARTATAEEKKRVWPIMTAQWPDYEVPGRNQARHPGGAADAALADNSRPKTVRKSRAESARDLFLVDENLDPPILTPTAR
jgi:deazaflavin-dependent oxidoreductase (nitroreductase family)